MPYLDAAWIKPNEVTPEPIPKGLWVPERDWAGWKRRGEGLAHRAMWDRDREVTRAELQQLGSLADDTLTLYLSVLGQDLGSVQRDSLFYLNSLEKLKLSQDTDTADTVVEAMEKLGFASAKWLPDAGGPPPKQSPRAVDRVLNWLLGLLAKVGKMILRIADVLVASLERYGVDVAVNIGAFPPSIGVDVSTTLFKQEVIWTAVHGFLTSAQDALAGV
jgi:hypothetical protein